MNKLKSAVLVGAVLASAGAGILAGAGGASAEGTPTPWASGANHDPNAVGGIQFFDANGAKITSGPTNTSPFSQYAVGTTVLHSGDDTATLFFYQPSAGSQDTWTNSEQLGLSTPYPNAAAPEPVKSTTLPTNTENASDSKLDGEVANFGATPVTGFESVYQIRLYSSSAASGVTAQYDYADIKIDSATHTWSLVYTPDQPGTSTTSALASNAPAGGINQGGTATLTDTIAPSSAAGTVQFKDGSTNVGSPVPVTGGKAVLTYSSTVVGNHTITADYTPGALSGFQGSTSNSVTVKVNKVVISPTLGLAVNPTTGPAFSTVHLTATLDQASAGAAGTMKFFDAGQLIGQASVSSGSAAIDYSGFAQGDHNTITATFTPSDPTSYNAATSPAADFNATAPTGPAPDVQNIDADVAAGSLAITTPYHPGNPLHVGTLALNANGTSLSGSAQFGDGTTPDGSIKVVDTRAGNANWTASAQSSDLVNGSDSINSQNVGLTALKGIYLPGNALQAGSVTFTDNAAAAPPVAPGTAGTQGLGNAAHQFARTTFGGDGTVGIYGTLTVNAPTSTQPGHYAGTVTFTIIGS